MVSAFLLGNAHVDPIDSLHSSSPEPPAQDEAGVHSAPIDYPFKFKGDAREYFRIWIVNLALSIVTLGVYSAWAKVRTQRYFYANTRVAGAPFEYLARPLPILKGRLIAVLLFATYVGVSEFAAGWRLLPLVIILLLTPWLVVRGAAFRARYSSWRGLNFRFTADYWGAYLWYLLTYLATLFSLGIFYPYQKGAQKRFMAQQHRYANQVFGFKVTPGRYYPPYLGAFGAIILWLILSSVFIATSGIGAGRGARQAHGFPATWTPMLISLFVYVGYFIVWAFLAAAVSNLTYNNIVIGRHQLKSSLQGRRVLWIYASNTVAILASLGMLIPWAQIRLARYRASCLILAVSGGLDTFDIVHSENIGALAIEMDGLFDIDIGL